MKQFIRYVRNHIPHIVIIKKNKAGVAEWWKDKPLVEGEAKGLHIINKSGLPAHHDIYYDQKDTGLDFSLKVNVGTASFQSGMTVFETVSGAEVEMMPITPVDNFDFYVSGCELIVNTGTFGTLAYTSTSGSLIMKSVIEENDSH